MSVAVTTVGDDVLVVRNPATGEEWGESRALRRNESAAGRSRSGAGSVVVDGLAGPPPPLDRWRRVLSRDADAWASLICSEVGKPRLEAMGGDVLSSLDAIRWTVQHAGRRSPSVGSDRPGSAGADAGHCVPLGSLGVIGMLGTWNYPLFLNAPPIAQALAAGNAVVFKSSESAPLAAGSSRRASRRPGFPTGCRGGAGGAGRGPGRGGIGRRQVMFTGGLEGGRRVLEAPGREAFRPWPSSRASTRPSCCPTRRSTRPCGR